LAYNIGQPLRLRRASTRQQLAQHELEDAAVAEVALLLGGVDPSDHVELPVVG
jgi:hypothetical protein